MTREDLEQAIHEHCFVSHGFVDGEKEAVDAILAALEGHAVQDGEIRRLHKSPRLFYLEQP